jgi:hypothetical protein
VSSDFFNEVDEELRADRWRTLFKKYLPWAISAGVALLLAYCAIWGWTAWRSHVSAKASEAYNRGLEALGSRNVAGARTAFAEAAKVGGTPLAGSPYRAEALMLQAGLLVRDGKTDEAVKMLDDAAKAAPDPVMKDLASLKAAFLLMDKAPYGDIEKRLKPLSQKKRPFEFYAREALAFEKLQTPGHAKDARAEFVVLSIDMAAPDDVRQRAAMAKQAIDDGVASALPSIVHAASAEAALRTRTSFTAPSAGSPAPQAGAASQ